MWASNKFSDAAAAGGLRNHTEPSELQEGVAKKISHHRGLAGSTGQTEKTSLLSVQIVISRE